MMNGRVNITRFSHHIGARNDFAMIELMDKHGFTGYAVYFMLLEIIFGSGQAILPIEQPGMLKKVARDIGVSPQELNALIEDMVMCGLFDRELYTNGHGLTNALIESDLNYMEERRRAGQIGAAARWGKKKKAGKQ